MTFTKAEVDSLIQKATDAANKAGDIWMAEAKPKYSVHQSDLSGNTGTCVGVLLDVCGNAHVKFRDKRTAFYKLFTKYGYIRHTGNGVVEIRHKWIPRQEYGLKIACAQAVKKVLDDAGVTGLTIWDYID